MKQKLLVKALMVKRHLGFTSNKPEQSDLIFVCCTYTASRGAQKDYFCYASSSVEVKEKGKVLYYVYLTLIHCWLTVVFTDGADYLFITIKRVDYEQ